MDADATAAARVALLTHAEMDVHASPGHPERPERRSAAADGVRHAVGAGLRQPAVVQVADDLLAGVHDTKHLDTLDAAERSGGGWIDPDTYLVRGTMRAARLAAGATVMAALAAARGDVEVAFAVVRPPGHHAARTRAGGFCLVNSMAVAVHALRVAGSARRVAIIDWDVHHGDGTQELFDADPTVCYTSTHQSPFYPGTGAAEERGRGEAAGTKHNRPLRAGSGDEDFVSAWRDRLLPAIEAFAPDALLISAGYDAHRLDPLAHLRVTEDGFGEVARMAGALSARLGLGGVALTLEGGYDLDALRASTAATVRGLLAGRRIADAAS